MIRSETVGWRVGIIAQPDWTDAESLTVMGRPRACFAESRWAISIRCFRTTPPRGGKKQYLVPYFISNFPGSTEAEMKAVEKFVREEEWRLQQVQGFIPLPMTPAAAVYYTASTTKPANRLDWLNAELR